MADTIEAVAWSWLSESLEWKYSFIVINIETEVSTSHSIKQLLRYKDGKAPYMSGNSHGQKASFLIMLSQSIITLISFIFYLVKISLMVYMISIKI